MAALKRFPLQPAPAVAKRRVGLQFANSNCRQSLRPEKGTRRAWGTRQKTRDGRVKGKGPCLKRAETARSYFGISARSRCSHCSDAKGLRHRSATRRLSGSPYPRCSRSNRRPNCWPRPQAPGAHLVAHVPVVHAAPCTLPHATGALCGVGPAIPCLGKPLSRRPRWHVGSWAENRRLCPEAAAVAPVSCGRPRNPSRASRSLHRPRRAVARHR